MHTPAIYVAKTKRPEHWFSVVEIQKGDMEALIATRHKIGYMLNFARENVLVLRKGDFLIIAFLLLLELDRFFSNWLFDMPVVLFLW